MLFGVFMTLGKHRRSKDGKFIYFASTLKLPIKIMNKYLKEKELIGTPIARQIVEILIKDFYKNK